MMRAAAALHRMENFPFARFDEIAPGISMILAPHPDDETLGCGGLIAAACDHGRLPFIVVITDGTGSHPGSASYPAYRLKALRKTELLSAAAILGVGPERVRFLELEDTHVPQEGPCFERAVDDIGLLVREHNVATIFTTWQHDPHCDHQATALIAATAAQITGARLMLYPVWGWLLPAERPLRALEAGGVRLDISASLTRKRLAIAAHASQYSSLFTDDPAGFRLPAELLAVFERPFEVFLSP